MLDTDAPEIWGGNIARVMEEGGFDLEMTHAIFMTEVGPAFHFNFLVVAGEWAGWDEEFVTARVSGRLKRARWLRRIGERLLRGQLQAVWDHASPYVVAAIAKAKAS